MSKQQWVLTRTVEEKVACPKCALNYGYKRVVEVKRDTNGKAELSPEDAAKMEEAFDNAVKGNIDVYKCPRCGAFRPGGFGAHLMMGAFLVVAIALCVGAAYFILAVAEATGALFWGLGLLALLCAAGGVLGLLPWLGGLFGIGIKKGYPLDAAPAP